MSYFTFYTIYFTIEFNLHFLPYTFASLFLNKLKTEPENSYFQTSSSDSHVTSPYNIHPLSNTKVIRILKLIKLCWSNTKFSKLCMPWNWLVTTCKTIHTFTSKYPVKSSDPKTSKRVPTENKKTASSKAFQGTFGGGFINYKWKDHVHVIFISYRV